MSEIDNHPHGIFCWSELCTHNWKEGKTFYTSLFDWGYDDQPIGEDIYYTMLQKQGGDIAAMYEMPKEQISEGIPSHWLAYIAVDNVDDCALKAKELGAEVIAGPHDVMNAGRMLMLKDPVGATVALWQGNEHKGCKHLGELNTPYWHELATRNSKVSRDFYCALLGWESEIKPMEGMNYTLFLVGGQPIAGMLEMTSDWPEDIPAHWMIYFSVESCDTAVNKAASLGGQVCVPATDIPDVGRFSVICDPQGAVFSVIESVIDDV
ncbi:VOC family protein [Pseudoalteromonas arctica]|uniref:VOC family protein n=1 Tax=Pseudoalteromonas arctica TaxID=394751 RepID=UPI002495392B|nr:VOC family protein [Pseudoalteromonas arctica]